jgi:hypothetical protein
MRLEAEQWSRRSGCLRVFRLRRKLAGFDPAVALPGDVDVIRRALYCFFLIPHVRPERQSI